MKVVLLEDVKAQGKRGDVINVSEGYAKNFLFPRHLAKEVDAQVFTELKNKESSIAFKEAEERKKATDLKAKLDSIDLIFKTTGGADGRLYGAITNKDISDKLLADYNLSIDKKKINVSSNIKTVGNFTVEIKLYKDITSTLKITVES